MKKHTNPYKFLFTLTLLMAVALGSFAAGGDDGEKQKTYTKSYPVGPNEKISITNKFGEVRIVTWDKAEVKVEIKITARSNSDEKAQSILDGITIEDGKNKDGVYFKTNMAKNQHSEWNENDDKKGEKRDHDKTGMNIDYTVSMPIGNPLSLDNQFGKSVVPDLNGPVEITQKFGDLVAGSLSNVKDFRVEFGKATVESINNCKVVVKYSTAEFKKTSGNIKGNFEFCGNIKMALDNSVTDFNLNNSYSTIVVTVSNNFSGDFDIHTSFGDFKNSTSLPIKEKKDEDGNGLGLDKDFSGKSGSGACKVKMKSSFGTIKFM